MPDIRHKYVSGVPSTGDSSIVQGPDWNEGHNLLQGPTSLLGRSDSVDGLAPTQEIQLDPDTMVFKEGMLSSTAAVPIAATMLDAEYLATNERSLPNPNLNVNGDFVVDGEIVGVPDDQDVIDDPGVMLVSQIHDLVQNGLYVYDKATNTLTRDPRMAHGSYIRKPLYIAVIFGQDEGGKTYELVEPEVHVGFEPSTWIESTGEGAVLTPPNQIMGGPASPTQRPGVSDYRTLSGADLPLLQPAYSNGNTMRVTVARSLKMARLSQVRMWADPWEDRTALMWMLANYKEIVIDCIANLYLPLPLVSNRRIIFEGNGWTGPRVCMWPKRATPFEINEPFDLGGTSDVSFDGQCVIEAMAPPTVSFLPAVRTSAAFTRFRCKQLWTSAFPNAFRITSAGDYDIDEIRVKNYPTEQPITQTIGSLPGQRVRRLPQVTGAALVDLITVTNAAYLGRPGANRYQIIAWGSGGGGGGGRRGATTVARAGGLGGGGTVPVSRFLRASDITFPVNVTIGAPGAGGASATVDTTDGGAGTDGADATFGPYLRARGGGRGGGGSTGAANGTTGNGAAGVPQGLSGVQTNGRRYPVSSSITNTVALVASAGDDPFGGAPGGTGSSFSAANAELVGIQSAWATWMDPAIPEPSPAATAGVNGQDGASSTMPDVGGNAGGGGGVGTTTAAGRGGNGGIGSGGGGGGASANGFASGAGGNGGGGRVTVIPIYE